MARNNNLLLLIISVIINAFEEQFPQKKNNLLTQGCGNLDLPENKVASVFDLQIGGCWQHSNSTTHY